MPDRSRRSTEPDYAARVESLAERFRLNPANIPWASQCPRCRRVVGKLIAPLPAITFP